MTDARKQMIIKAAAMKTEICKQQGTNANYKTWVHFMSTLTNKQLKESIESMEHCMGYKVVIV